MADSRFFSASAPISIGDLAALTGASVSGESDKTRLFSDVAPLDRADSSHVSFLDNTKYLTDFSASKAGACFVREKFATRAPAGMILLVTEEPYYAYALAAQYFYPREAFTPAISPAAHIAKTASIGAGCRIDSGAVIGEHVKLGKGCWIGANTVISDGVEIGDDSRIGALCSISHAIIGGRAFFHRGVHIGQDGFGFAPGRGGVTKVPQLGRVMIGDDVEIGSNSCIDRGAGPDTVIGSGTKIDNLVQIGHNVQIGRFVFVVAQTGIAGSTHIGDGAMLGGQSGFAGHLSIGAGAKIAAQAGVMADVPAGASYGGAPAQPIKDWHRQTVAITNLVKKRHVNE
ncbi:MAG: UDP-3-O-(3-hydroxymyristoyl)glucosamine N-acyltransferase [Alphaproteobacteria bacterium]|nr:UDP-3-O-(3-hydroxymyristoyl)glucosamine N-acyltransferase [Alphaproteobacteria bacterium]